MNLKQLLRQFPWAGHALVRTFANSFSEPQWQDLSEIGIEKLVTEGRIDDDNLYQLLKQISDVANDPQVKEAIATGEVSFWNIAKKQLEERMEHPEKTPNNECSFNSALHYLTEIGFNNLFLIALFRDLDTETAIEFSGLIARLHDAHMTKEEKRQRLQESWKQSLPALSFTCGLTNPTPLDVLEYVTNTLTYDEYILKSSAQNPVFFKQHPTLGEFELLKKKTITLADFFTASVLFVLKAPEKENNAEKNSETKLTSV